VQLDDTTRTVEVIDALPPGGWDDTGSADDVARWLGNATEHDREAIRSLAREIAGPRKALLVTFPSVLPFLLDYAGAGRYRIYVPTDHPAGHVHYRSGHCDACGVWVEVR